MQRHEPPAEPEGHPAAARLAYENIVAFLRSQRGAVLDTQIRQGYSSAVEADPFVPELLVLLVGIEGTQNNVMALHAPMVTDLVAEGILDWNLALLTGRRSTNIEDIPWYTFAADKNQKGSSDRSTGPMQRQMILLRSGRFDDEAERSDQARVLNEQERAKLQKYIEQRLREWADEIATEILSLKKGKYKKKLEFSKDADLDKINETISKEARAKKIPEATKEFEAQEGKITKASGRASPHEGYTTFRHSYMTRQFQLQEVFFTTMFPQVLVLNFSGPDQFLEFAERLVERYLFHRFYAERWLNMSASLDRSREKVDQARRHHYHPAEGFL